MTNTSRGAAALFTAGSIAGLGISIYNYVTPLSGIEGTEGALLVIASTAALTFAGIMMFVLRPGGLRKLFKVLSVLGILGTLAAAYFLHAWFLMIAMAVALVGLVVLMSQPATPTTRTHRRGAAA